MRYVLPLALLALTTVLALVVILPMALASLSVTLPALARIAGS